MKKESTLSANKNLIKNLDDAAAVLDCLTAMMGCAARGLIQVTAGELLPGDGDPECESVGGDAFAEVLSAAVRGILSDTEIRELAYIEVEKRRPNPYDEEAITEIARLFLVQIMTIMEGGS
jgi:hypothetical protein